MIQSRRRTVYENRENNRWEGRERGQWVNRRGVVKVRGVVKAFVDLPARLALAANLTQPEITQKEPQ